MGRGEGVTREELRDNEVFQCCERVAPRPRCHLFTAVDRLPRSASAVVIRSCRRPFMHDHASISFQRTLLILVLGTMLVLPHVTPKVSTWQESLKYTGISTTSFSLYLLICALLGTWIFIYAS